MTAILEQSRNKSQSSTAISMFQILGRGDVTVYISVGLCQITCQIPTDHLRNADIEIH